MKESELEAKCTRYAKDRQILSFKFQSANNRGVPDRIFMGGGAVLFVEFKQKGKKPSALQDKVMGTMREHGALVAVIDDYDNFKELVNGTFAA